MVSITVTDYKNAVRDILDEKAHLEARLRAMYLIKNDGKTYENAKILMEAASKTDSVLLEHELYYNLGQFQLTGEPVYEEQKLDGQQQTTVLAREGDDIVRYLMEIISSTKPKHDSISRHEALEALGAIFANPLKGTSSGENTVTKKGDEESKNDASSPPSPTTIAFPNLRAEVLAYLDDLTNNERILSVRQSAELARDRLLHADQTKEQYLLKQTQSIKRWREALNREEAAPAEDLGNREESEDKQPRKHDDKDKFNFFTKWVAPSQVHTYLSVDPSPAFDEEENDVILASLKRYQNLEKARARVAELALILRNEVKKPKTTAQSESDVSLTPTPSSAVDNSGGQTSSNSTNDEYEIVPGNYSLFDRYRAMFSLRNIGTPEAIEILSDALNTDKSSALFRHEIAFVLGQIEKNSCEKALIDCLCNPKEAGMVRHEAAIAIGGIAQPTGLAALELHANDRDKIVADSCVAGLEMHRYWSEFLEKARAFAEAAEKQE